MVNALGEVSRAEIMEEMLESMPEIGPFLAALWGEKGTTIHVASGSSSWDTIVLVDGLFQGHSLSSLLFCLALQRALRRFSTTYGSHGGVQPTVMAYIDDLLLKLDPNDAGNWLPKLKESLASVNLVLNFSKTQIFIPSSPSGLLHPVIAAHGLKQCFQSLDLLGGALEGEFATTLSACAVLPAAALKRDMFCGKDGCVFAANAPYPFATTR